MLQGSGQDTSRTDFVFSKSSSGLQVETGLGESGLALVIPTGKVLAVMPGVVTWTGVERGWRGEKGVEGS